MSDRRFYLDELASDECFCGRGKQSGRSFCYGCYKSLPPEMQKALWQRMGDGYEGAYDEAVAWLT